MPHTTYEFQGKKVIKKKFKSAWNLFIFLYILGALQWVKNYYIQLSSAKSVTLFERPSLCQKLPSLPLSGKWGFAERERLRKWVAVPATVGEEDEFGGGERKLKKPQQFLVLKAISDHRAITKCGFILTAFSRSVASSCLVEGNESRDMGFLCSNCGRDQISADCPNVGRFTYLFFVRILDKELHEGYQTRMKAGE